MTSKLVVNTIEADTGISSVSFASSISLSSTSKFHFSAAGIDIDADTNINRPAAGVIGFNINSSEKVRINSNGQLGIGTDNVTRGPLHIHEQSTSDCQIHLTNDNTGVTSSDGFTIFTGQSNGDCGFVSRESGGSIEFYTHNGTSVGERLRITSGGNVDINGTPPWTVTGGDYRNLSISGQVANSGGFIWLGNGAATTNADHDLGRINFLNGATIVARVIATTDTSNNDDGRVSIYTKKTGQSEAERLRIASDGRTLINTTAVTNTNDTLTVKRAAGSWTEMSMTVDANTATGTHANAFVFTKSKNTYWNGLGFQSSHGHIGAIVGMRDSTGMNASHKMRIEIGGTGINASEEKTWDFLNTGDLSISDGNLKLASGHGIDFSATGQASGMSNELLDDYEEGSFTLTASPSSGTMTFNSSYNQGTYTKMGNVVHIQAYLSISGNSGSGTLELNSLPFTVKDSTDASGHVRAFSIVYLNNNSPVDGSGYYLAQVYANEGNTWIRIYQVNSLGRRSGDIANKFGGGGDIFLQFTYFAS